MTITGSEEQQYGEEYFDPEEYDYEKERVDTLPSLLKNISRFQLDEYIKVMVETSKSASEKIKNEIDFLFIDGSILLNQQERLRIMERKN